MSWRARYGEIDGQFVELQMLVRDVGTHPQSLVLLKAATEFATKLLALSRELEPATPPSVVEAFDRFARSAERHLTGATRLPGFTDLALVTAAAVLRARLRPELESREPEWVERVELALLHLQRQLEVEQSVHVRWASAFVSGEVELERLGGVHFLSHRIFAFKADAGGGRTDLVLGTPPSLADIERTHAPLVLTEWKKVTGDTSTARETDLGRKFEAAVVQLGRYRRGALAGTELHRTCFAVMVAEHDLPHIDDSHLPTGELIRVVSINVAPVQPSSTRRLSSQV